MSDITMIGLGAMGATLARVLMKNHCDLTIWNRSPAKAEPLVKSGAGKVDRLSEAIKASRSIIICINHYASARKLLEEAGVLPLLKNRTVIQLSTGTPAEAREMEKWIHRQGGYYLDGAIMVYPESIGSPQAQILVAGDDRVYRDNRIFLEMLGGDIRYLGPNIGAASALDLAAVTRLVVNTLGIIHGVNVCLSEKVPLEQYADLYPEGDRARTLAMKIRNNRFDENISVTVDVSIGVVSSIKRQADDLGINSELPDFILSLYRRAEAAGYGQLDNASLIRILQSDL